VRLPRDAIVTFAVQRARRGSRSLACTAELWYTHGVAIVKGWEDDAIIKERSVRGTHGSTEITPAQRTDGVTETTDYCVCAEVAKGRWQLIRENETGDAALGSIRSKKALSRMESRME